MSIRDPYSPRPTPDIETVPFASAEEAWFWFIQAQSARSEGARLGMGLAAVPRPCEPVDILKVVDRLYRQRRLLRDHLLVLRHYGRRLMAPDTRRVKEIRAARLWREALARLGPALAHKGIVAVPDPWADPAFLSLSANIIPFQEVTR